MKYKAQNFDHLFGLKGFSDRLLKAHFALYQGYVANTNKLCEAPASESPEAKRRFGWEFNGMRLHDLYFGNMAKKGPQDKGKNLSEKLSKDFGSQQDWEDGFKSIAKLRGVGWVLLSYDPAGDRLFNIWVNEHDGGNLAGCAPLLVLDVFEHAYLTYYGLKREEYVEAFFKAFDWGAVSKRFKAA